MLAIYAVDASQAPQRSARAGPSLLPQALPLTPSQQTFVWTWGQPHAPHCCHES